MRISVKLLCDNVYWIEINVRKCIYPVGWICCHVTSFTFECNINIQVSIIYCLYTQTPCSGFKRRATVLYSSPHWGRLRLCCTWWRAIPCRVSQWWDKRSLRAPASMEVSGSRCWTRNLQSEPEKHKTKITSFTRLARKLIPSTLLYVNI